ncbi:MAG: type IV toxin-antitoxin system AbiEi family antitoxin domain-containing protein [Candidatus Eisenbacteria sp.]|nr:type IV toxin-antitoxin system AbiEi family antitoxin domain-containing protein [Candidatus Eisenbacteria bacterium]
MTQKNSRERVLRLAHDRGFIGASEVAELGIHTQILSRLVRAGLLERVVRGTYRLSDSPVTEHHGLALAAAAVPRGVICLLSALGFHGIGTQLPFEVWLALDRRARRPAVRYPPLRVVRFSGLALTVGIETHTLEGQSVRIYGIAKTLADCFKYRNKIGLDVALEALNDAWQKRRVTMDEIDEFAQVCRVSLVMRPYLEALVG